MNTDKVTRVNVIDHRKDANPFGLVYTVREGDIKVDLYLQDDERTLKVFINDRVYKET